jgi:hypothetical protein
VLPAVFTGQVYSCSGGGTYANGGGYGFNYGGFAGPQSFSAPRRFVRFEVGFGNGRRIALSYDGGFRGWGGGYRPFATLPAGYGYPGGGFYRNGGYYQNGGSFPNGGFGPPRVFEGSSFGGVV